MSAGLNALQVAALLRLAAKSLSIASDWNVYEVDVAEDLPVAWHAAWCEEYLEGGAEEAECQMVPTQFLAKMFEQAAKLAEGPSDAKPRLPVAEPGMTLKDFLALTAGSDPESQLAVDTGQDWDGSRPVKHATYLPGQEYPDRVLLYLYG